MLLIETGSAQKRLSRDLMAPGLARWRAHRGLSVVLGLAVRRLIVLLLLASACRCQNGGACLLVVGTGATRRADLPRAAEAASRVEGHRLEPADDHIPYDGGSPGRTPPQHPVHGKKPRYRTP